MSKVVSKIIDKCNNSGDAKLNILLHEFDIETELAISKTGHNFFRVQLQPDENIVSKTAEYPNFFVLPVGQVPFYIEYDMIVAKNGSFSEKFLQDMHHTLQLPFLIIDPEREEFDQNMAFTNKQDKNSDSFIEDWKELLEKFRGIYT